MKNKYRNPWADATQVRGAPFFEHDGPKLGEWRGVEVFKNPAGSFDFVLNGCALTLRAGFDPQGFRAVVDEILNGERAVADTVAAHLRACGHSPLTFAEASAIDRCKLDGWKVPARGSDAFDRMLAHYSGPK